MLLQGACQSTCNVELVKTVWKWKHTASGFGKKSASIDMHTTHLLFLLSALASDYEHSTRPSKKSSETTNRTNKKNNPSPSPFFAAKRPPQSPAEILTSWPSVFNSTGICWFLSWRLHCFSALNKSGAKTIGSANQCYSHLPVHDPHIDNSAILKQRAVSRQTTQRKNFRRFLESWLQQP